MKKVNIISLGCNKNLVDSETIAGILASEGFLLISKPQNADIVILNTCAFIDSARREAYSNIENLLSNKPEHQKLVLCGCLPQREKSTLFKKYPQIDAILGSSDFKNISDIINSLYTSKKTIMHVSQPRFIISSQPKLFSTPKSYAYIKISEGCNNHCNYCIIPKLRGPFRSRRMEYIINDVKNAISTGRKEVILVGQDTTLYGIDIYKKQVLHILLENISKIQELKWIRLLYTHPAHFTDDLISTIAENEKICKYIDIPIQHTVDSILEKMGRPSSKIIFNCIEKLQRKIHNITLRTTIIVGFPGETEEFFQKLLKDINNLSFHWLGAFMFSKVRGTRAYKLTDSLPSTTKQARYNELMETQQKITLNKNMEWLGKKIYALADTSNFGHSEFQAPEIDGRIIFTANQNTGSFKKHQIRQVKNVYDLKTA